jgi:hypothetical protein
MVSAKDLARASCKRTSEDLAQRRQGRKLGEKPWIILAKQIHLFPPILACFAPWRESIKSHYTLAFHLVEAQLYASLTTLKGTTYK